MARVRRPSRRAATIALSCSLVVGTIAGIGAARSNVEFWGLLLPAPSATSSPSASGTPAPKPTGKTTKRPDESPSPDPTPTRPVEPEAPTEFVNVAFGTGITVDVPVDWQAVEKAAEWRDFRDPTGNLNLRIRVDEFGADNEEAANKQRKIRSRLRGYTGYGISPFERRTLGPDGEQVEETGYAFRYSYTEKRGVVDATRHVVERFVEGGTVMVGSFAWYGQLALVEPAARRAMATFAKG